MFHRAVLLLLCSVPFTAAFAAAPPSAEILGDDLKITGPPGASVELFDVNEKRIASGVIRRSGSLTFAGQGRAEDPMLRIVAIDSKRRPLSDLLPAVELWGVLPPRIAAGLPLVPHVRVRDRTSGKPVAGIDVLLTLKCGKRVVALGAARSGDDGVTVGEAGLVPADLTGSCRLSAFAAGATLFGGVTITRGARVIVSTDRPVYKPGDTIHARTVALDLATGSPIAGGKGTIELVDEADRVVHRADVKTSDFGLAPDTLSVPSDYRDPAITVRYTHAGATASKRVKVGLYRPPQILVTLETAQAAYRAGEPITASVSARRLDGGPVGDAVVELRGRMSGDAIFQVEAALDDDGLATLTAKLPPKASDVSLEARVQTVGGKVGKATAAVAIDKGHLDVWAIPESGHLVPGVVNGVWIVTQQPDGRPVRARAVLRAGRKSTSVDTDTDGLAFARIHVPATAKKLHLRATASERLGKRALTIDSGRAGALLHLDSAVSKAGATLRASFHVPKGRGTAVLELIRADHASTARSAPIREGVATFELTVPEGAGGTVTLRAWALDRQGTIRRDARLVLLDDPRDLRMSLTPDRAAYAPRGEAKVRVRVTDAKGRPQVAAVALSAVDEGLVALGLEQPGLERAFARLGHAWDKTAPDIPAWQREALFDAADHRRLEVLAAAAAASAPIGSPAETGPSRLSRARMSFQPAVQRRADAIGAAMSRWYRVKNRRQKRVRAARLVQKRLLGKQRLVDPWGRPITVELAPGDCCRATVTVRSPGIDGKPGTPDDITASAPVSNYFRNCRCHPRVFAAMGRAGFGGRGVGFGGGGAHYAVGGEIRKPAVLRTELPDTLAVEPSLITDERGEATWTVTLADSLTTWLVQARAISKHGGLGAAEARLRVQQPFSVDVALPASVVRGDWLDVPVALTNQTGRARTVAVNATGSDGVRASLETGVQIPPGATRAVTLRIAADAVGQGAITVRAEGDGVADAIRRTITVQPDGVPLAVMQTGTLRAGAAQAIHIDVPDGGLPGSRALDLRLYPGALGTVVEGLDALLRMPGGCFEQTSATTYPNALVLDYLEKADRDSPELAARARSFLKAGWKRLISYEVKGGGFSWFGDAPANRILTAFGLLEFFRMGKVMEVDPKVIARTRKWLWSQRRADGAWAPDEEYLHAESWSRIQNAALPVTAYIVWALASTGADSRKLSKSVRWLEAHADEATDPYVLSLVALALTTADPRGAAAVDARARLAGISEKGEQGRKWTPKAATHTYAGGDSAAIETSALAVLALLDGGDHSNAAQEGMDWLLTKRRPGGGWWTTQSTVLSLEALLTAEATATAPADGMLSVAEHGREVGRDAVTPEDYDVVRAFALDPAPGERALSARLNGEGGLRYQLSAVRRVPAADLDASDAPLTLAITTSANEATLGQAVTLSATMTAGDAQVRMPTIELGIPAGFELDEQALPGGFDKIEVLGRRVVVYLQQMKAGESRTATFTMRARREGQTAPGPCRAWPYYEPDKAHWVEPAAIITRAAP